uniref:Uncharacterized protein LOC111101899 n=1 Tax=Crassostrea virginica TaxID=6565 RepID=A0A8B8AFW7_CRAVI|nr:uncharacterized protein LOC111101899 [Crassostrea virginica]
MESEWCCLIFFLLSSVVLQSSGFFSPYWINYKSNNGTTECFRGVLYNSGCPDYVNRLGATVLVFQAASLVIILWTTLTFIRAIYCNGNDDDDEDIGRCALLSGCMIYLYPVSGIIGFSGCTLVANNFGEYKKGWAFYISFVASCYVILQLFFYCWVICKKKKGSSEESGGLEVTLQFTRIFHIS